MTDTLGAFWYIFLLGEHATVMDPTADTTLDLLCPPDLGQMRTLYGSVFSRVNPPAATGLLRTDDPALTYWQRILRFPQLTGEKEELAFLPVWCWAEDVILNHVAVLLRLPFTARMDVFMSAMTRAAA